MERFESATEIGLPHLLVLNDALGRAFGELAALVEDDDPFADTGDDVDVVLDHEEAHAERFVGVLDASRRHVR